VSYVNRSGSTFFVTQLSRYSNVCVCPEGELLVHYLLYKPELVFSKSRAKYFSGLYCNDEKLPQWNLDINFNQFVGKKCFEVFFYILEQYKRQYSPNATQIVFKDQSLYKLAFKKNILNVRHVILHREPKAILNSQLKSIEPNKGDYFSKNPLITLSAIRKFKKDTRAKHFFSYQLYYEDLVRGIPLENLLPLRGERRKNGIYRSFILNGHEALHSKAFCEIDVCRVDAWRTELDPFFSEIADIICSEETSCWFFNIMVSHFSILHKCMNDYIMCRVMNFVYKGKEHVKWLLKL